MWYNVRMELVEAESVAAMPQQRDEAIEELKLALGRLESGGELPGLSEASFNAAVSRLDDVIARAEKLKGEGRVIEKEGWLDEPDETLPTGDISVKKPNGAFKKLGGQIAHDANRFLCTSIFVRDGFNKIFS